MATTYLSVQNCCDLLTPTRTPHVSPWMIPTGPVVDLVKSLVLSMVTVNSLDSYSVDLVTGVAEWQDEQSGQTEGNNALITVPDESLLLLSIPGARSKNTVTSKHRRQYTEAVGEAVEGEGGLPCRRDETPRR